MIDIEQARDLLRPVVGCYAEIVRPGHPGHTQKLAQWVRENLGTMLAELQALRAAAAQHDQDLAREVVKGDNLQNEVDDLENELNTVRNDHQRDLDSLHYELATLHNDLDDMQSELTSTRNDLVDYQEGGLS